jgi:hypothetical protein
MLYSMAKGEKPIPEKYQAIFQEIFGVRKFFWGKELIPPAFSNWETDTQGYNDLEREIIEVALSNTVPITYSRLVATQPARDKQAQKNLERTVYRKVPCEQIGQFLKSKNISERLNRLTGGKGVVVWGVQRGVYNQWNKLSFGDFVVFYANKHFFLSGTIILTIHSPELARLLWPDDQDEPFEYLYMMTDIKEISVDLNLFNKILGYSQNNIVRGFKVLDSEKSQKIIDIFDFSNNVQPLLNKESFVKELSWSENSLDKSMNQMGRIEQSYLRRHLLGERPYNTCCICHKSLPNEVLITSHIKKRSICSYEEKIDLNIVMPLCRNCDVWYENGYLSVNNRGKVVCVEEDDQDKIVTADLALEFKNINGNDCLYWSINTKDYFEWHFKFNRFHLK